MTTTLSAYVARTIATAPPLTDEQRDRITAVLRSSTPMRGRSGDAK